MERYERYSLEAIKKLTLEFQIENYIQAFFNINGVIDIEKAKNDLEKVKNEVLTILDRTEIEGVFSRFSVCETWLSKEFNTIDFFQTVPFCQILLRHPYVQESQIKSTFDDTILPKLEIICKIQTINNEMESQTQNIEVPNVENQKRMKALFLKDLGIDKILSEKGYNSDDSKALIVRWLCGYDEVQNPTTWYGKYLIAHTANEKEQNELEKLKSKFFKYRKHHKEKPNLQ